MLYVCSQINQSFRRFSPFVFFLISFFYNKLNFFRNGCAGRFPCTYVMRTPPIFYGDLCGFSGCLDFVGAENQILNELLPTSPISVGGPNRLYSWAVYWPITSSPLQNANGPSSTPITLPRFICQP